AIFLEDFFLALGSDFFTGFNLLFTSWSEISCTSETLFMAATSLDMLSLVSKFSIKQISVC
ncbi:hypothetical protein ACO1L5_13705, partial [Staphylococcus aureus]